MLHNRFFFLLLAKHTPELSAFQWLFWLLSFLLLFLLLLLMILAITNYRPRIICNMQSWENRKEPEKNTFTWIIIMSAEEQHTPQTHLFLSLCVLFHFFFKLWTGNSWACAPIVNTQLSRLTTYYSGVSNKFAFFFNGVMRALHKRARISPRKHTYTFIVWSFFVTWFVFYSFEDVVVTSPST